MNIRRATGEDTAALASIHAASWRAAYRDLVPDAYLERLDSARRFRESLDRNAEETYVAERDGEILGFLTIGPCRDADLDPRSAGEIQGLYLAPEHWREGVGTALCRFGEALLQCRGCRTATLWVLAGNPRARRFYEALGFAADGASVTAHLGAPLEAVRYRKPLAESDLPDDGRPAGQRR